MDFIIDTTGFKDGETEHKKEHEFLKKLFEDCPDVFKTTHNKKPVDDTRNSLFSEILSDLKDTKKNKNKEPLFDSSDIKAEVRNALKKSILGPEFDQLKTVPPLEVSARNLKKLRQKEKEKSKGKKWYGLPATEMTEEVKHDLEVLQMRSVLDPKHFYKKNDLKVLPKYFEVGKVLDSPLEFYNGRLTKKERKKTLVDELLADAEFHKYNKRKYKEIIEEKQRTHYKAWRQAKRLKKKK